MSYLKSLSLLVLSISLVGLSQSFCPEIQLIQKLNNSFASYVMVSEGKYYMISEQDLQKKTLPQPIDLPQGFEDNLGAIVYHYDCPLRPHEHKLLVYKSVMVGQHGTFSNIQLDLANRSKWTQPSNNLPTFLIHAGSSLPNIPGRDNKIDFSMFWYQKRTLFVIGPNKKDPNIKTYFSLHPDERSCDVINVFPGANIDQVLNPYKGIDSCFVHKDSKLICFGDNEFKSFDIVLNATEGRLRVENYTKNVGRIPIMDLIEQIKCPPTKPTTKGTTSTTPTTSQESQTVIPVSPSMTYTSGDTEESSQPTEDGSETPSYITDDTEENSTRAEEGPEISTSDTTPRTENPKEDDNQTIKILAIILILTLIVVFIAFILYYCCRKKVSPEEGSSTAPTETAVNKDNSKMEGLSGFVVPSNEMKFVNVKKSPKNALTGQENTNVANVRSKVDEKGKKGGPIGSRIGRSPSTASTRTTFRTSPPDSKVDVKPKQKSK